MGFAGRIGREKGVDSILLSRWAEIVAIKNVRCMYLPAGSDSHAADESK